METNNSSNLCLLQEKDEIVYTKKRITEILCINGNKHCLKRIPRRVTKKI